MTYGSEKRDEYVTHRIRTSTGMETISYLIRKDATKTYTCYSSAHSSPGPSASGSSVAGTTHCPDGASGWTTLVGTAQTKYGAKRLARKAAKALDLGETNY